MNFDCGWDRTTKWRAVSDSSGTVDNPLTLFFDTDKPNLWEDTLKELSVGDPDAMIHQPRTCTSIIN